MKASRRRLAKLQIEELEARIAPTVLTVGVAAKEREAPLSHPLLSLPEATQDTAMGVPAPGAGASDIQLAPAQDPAAPASPVTSAQAAGGPTEAQLPLMAGGDGSGDGGEPSGGSSYVISGVPAYLWYAGCAPTAGGMILGYWDGNGFSNLVVGDASDTSPLGNLTNIDNMIATPEFFTDYNGSPDNSEPGQSHHTDNCVADFMHTSQSYYMQADSWTGWNYAGDGLLGYAQYRGYSDADAWSETRYSATLWTDVVADLNAGYPVMFLVDYNGDGSTDHFVTVVGYNDSTMEYAAYNTWDSSVHWYPFTLFSISQPHVWSVYGATFFRPGALPQMALALDPGSDSGVSASDRITNNTMPTFDVTVPGAGTIFMDYNNDGTYDQQLGVTQAGTYQLQNSSAFLDGGHTIRAHFTPSAGSDVESTIGITVDTVAPGVPNIPDLAAASDSGLLSTDNITNDSTPTLDLSGFGTYYRLYRDSVQMTGEYATAASFTEALTPDGSYSYTLRAVDAAGNVSAASSALSVTVDTVAPSVPSVPGLHAGSDSGFSNSDHITNVASPTLDLSGFGTYYRLFRGAAQVSTDYATVTSFTEASPLTDGSYSYTLRAVDAAGNLSAASGALAVSIDTVAPSVPNVPDLNGASDSGFSASDNITNDTTPTLDLSGFGSYYRLFRGSTQLSGDYATASSFTEASPLTDGSYSYALRAVDTAGNVSSATSALSVTVDTVAPAVPNVPDLNAASDDGLLSTDNITNDSTPTLDLSGFGSYYRLYRDSVQMTGEYATAASFTEAPALDGSYSYTLRAIDAAGNLSAASAALSVTIDTVAPSVPNAPDLNAASDSGFSGTDNITNDATPTFDLSGFGSYYRLYRGATQVTGDYASAASFTEASPLVDGSYSYTLRAVDTAGNLSAASAALSVTIDTVAPAVPNVPDLNAASDSGFSTSDNITSDTTPTLDLSGFGSYYRLFRGSIQLSGDYATASSFTEASPLVDGSYSYTLRAVDTAGNVSVASAALPVTIDTVAPGVPNVPDLNAASDSGLSSSDNITNIATPILDLSGFGSYYRLYRGAAQVSTDYATAASFTEGAPLLDGSYNYTLRAVDTAGNLSAASAALPVTVDTVAPSVPDAPDLNAASDSGFSSSDNITNDSTPSFDLSGFGTYYRLYRGGVLVSGDYATATSSTEASPLADGSYSYTLRSVDAAGNLSAASGALPVTIDTVAPGVPNLPDLNAGSDSGFSSSDNITNDSTPSFDLSGFGTYYRLYRGATQVSGDYATAASFTEASPLVDGSHSYTLRSVDAAGNLSTASGALSVTIDTVAPTVTVTPAPGAALDSPPAQAVATFNEDMDPTTITASTFTLLASGQDGTFGDGNETQILPASLTYDAGNHAATFTVNGSLGNDTYRITVVGSTTIRDVTGNALDGNSDGTGGDDYMSSFMVGAPRLVITDSLGAAADRYLDFGFLALPAGSGVGTVTLANSGPTTLLVSSIALSDPLNYSISWDGDGSAPTSLAAGAQRVATVNLHPAALGAAPAALTVQSNDPLESTATVSLDGTGYVSQSWTSGPTTVVVVDAGGSADLLRENVTVRFGRDGAISSIRLGGKLPMDGVGILISGAPSVGSIIDARQGPLGALSFIASDAPISNLSLKGPVAGLLLNGRSLQDFSFAPDIDGDGNIRDHTAFSLSHGVRTLRVSGSIAGDVLLGGSVTSLQSTAGLAGDLLVAGNAGTVTVGGDLGLAGGRVSVSGNLGRLTLSSRVGPANLLADLEVGGTAQAISIGSRTLGGGAQGDIEVWGILRNLTVAGAVTGDVTAHGDLTRATVGGDLGTESSTFHVGGALGNLTVGSRTLGGDVQGEIEVWGALRNLTVAGAVTGDVTAHGDLTRATVGGDLGTQSSTFHVGGALGNLTVGTRTAPADLVGELVVAGKLSNLAVSRDVRGAVTVGGNLTTFTAQHIASAITVAGDLGSLSTTSTIGPGVPPVDAVFTNNPEPIGSLTVTGAITKLRQLA
jgi:chitodextrinase